MRLLVAAASIFFEDLYWRGADFVVADLVMQHGKGRIGGQIVHLFDTLERHRAIWL